LDWPGTPTVALEGFHLVALFKNLTLFREKTEPINLFIFRFIPFTTYFSFPTGYSTAKGLSRFPGLNYPTIYSRGVRWSWYSTYKITLKNGVNLENLFNPVGPLFPNLGFQTVGFVLSNL